MLRKSPHKILHVCCSALSHRLENLGRGTKDRSCTQNSRCLQETKLQTHSTTQSEKTPATLKHSPSLFKKRSPNRDGMPANFDSSLLASEEERKNQRNQRTNGSNWTDATKTEQRARERGRAQSCGRLNKAMSTQVTRTQQSETRSEWESEGVVPPKPQTDDEEWREVTEAAKTRREANDGLSGGLQKRERGRGAAGVRGRERASDGGKNAGSGNIDSSPLAMAGS